MCSAGVGVTDSGRGFVYVLKSLSDPSRYYVGVTTDVNGRLTWHNDGACESTREYRPWIVDVIIAFADQERAIRFEKYLKSGSGRAFAKRHFN